jgi:hypothetical protein
MILDDKKDKRKLKLINITDYLTLRELYRYFPYRKTDYPYLKIY